MRVFLFVPCYIDQLFPNVAESTLKVLKHLGCEVVFPENQTCCGQPAYNSGYFEEARLMAAHELQCLHEIKTTIAGKNIEFDPTHDYIVGQSLLCVIIRNFYRNLLSDNPLFAEQIERFTSWTLELTEFVNSIIKIDNFKGRLSAVVSYHDSCHSLRELGLKDEARNILKKIEGLNLVELPYNDVCCGFGGTFAVKFPEISCSMADEKLRKFDSTRADILVSAQGPLDSLTRTGST